MFFLAVLLIILFFIAGKMLALSSRDGAPPGLLHGRLHPCPATPNCVCSEAPQAAGFVEPLPVVGEPGAAWARIQQVVVAMGGTIVRQEKDYLAATFKSVLFGFIDDVELRPDTPAGVIHIRSASRVGRSDLGMNRKRVAEVRRRYSLQTPP